MANKTEPNESPQTTIESVTENNEANKTGDTESRKGEKTAAAAPKTDPMEEYVEIMIPRSEKNPGPVPIGVNGKIVLVRRGEYVKVRRKFAEALKMSYAMENEAADRRDMLQREFQNAKM